MDFKLTEQQEMLKRTMNDFPVERYFRDARGLLLVAQPLEVRKLMAGRLKLGLPPMGPPGSPPPPRREG